MWYEKLRQVSWLDGVLVVGIGLIVVGLGMNVWGADRKEKVELIKGGEYRRVDEVGSVVQGNSKVMIDMGGEVVRPGVYGLKTGARVNDALVAAGGLGVNADREWVERNLNKAGILRDGMKIYIPNKDQSRIQNLKILGTEDGLISINAARVEELDKLPGIGPSLAGMIVDYLVE